MDINNKILSDITVFMKYAKYLPKESRRESWEELVTRNKNMHLKKFPKHSELIEHAYKVVYDRKVLPSMRSMQFAGLASEINPARLYNCSFLIANDVRCFQETMFLLLSGCGVGYSVQKHHVRQLPEIIKPNSKNIRRYVVGDSITGWADAIKALMKSYFGQKNVTYEFDYSDIRPKGAMLVTSGGKAPGAEPLRNCINNITKILNSKENGDKLTTLEVHDIMCHIADSVLAGGIRRAALIALFSINDKEMLSCKQGEWWIDNPQRGRANNSAVLVRSRIDKDNFFRIWQKVKESGCGEPGISWTNNAEAGFNPCHEISLKNMQFCNLCEVNVSDIESQEDLNNRVKAASIIGTLQASYTNFHYLRNDWKLNSEKDALLGISLTGIASNTVFNFDLEEAARVANDINEEIAKLIGINKAARVTTVKPAGTTSLVFGTSSGIHAWHDKFYIRRIRVGKNEAIYTYLAIYHPELIEDCQSYPETTAIIKVPQRAPETASTREESALDLLSRVKLVTQQWVNPGFRKGYNQHNVSCTVSVKDNEWQEVGDWMWDNRDSYSGISVLPYSDHSYVQPPFETCTEDVYVELSKSLSNIDLSKVVEMFDSTDLKGEAACGGGGCEIK